MITNDTLKEPKSGSYIWKYFDDSNDYRKLRTFLKGEIYFSNLLCFDDYLEGINPLYYYYLEASKYCSILNYKKYFEKIGFEKMSFSFQNILSIMHMGLFDARINELLNEKKIVGVTKKNVVEKLIEEHAIIQKENFVSCWFSSNDAKESYAMWKNYSGINGVAIRMNYKHFKKKIIEKFNEKLDYGLIEYTDYKLDRDWPDRINKGIPSMYFKHNSFNNEKEFRIRLTKKNENGGLKLTFLSLGIYNLFDIILHPSSFSMLHFIEIEKIVRENNLQAHIYFSELSYRPVNKLEAEKTLKVFDNKL